MNERHASSLRRRDFLIGGASLASALVIGFVIPSAHAETRKRAGGQGTSSDGSTVPEINAWVVVASDDSVTLRINQPELGQGVFTAVAMMINEELQADWKRVRGEYASSHRNEVERAPDWVLVPTEVEPTATDPHTPGGEALPARFRNLDTSGVYRRLATNGYNSVRTGMAYYQRVGAEARERLLLAASTVLQLSVRELAAKGGVITHVPSGRSVTYGSVAGRAARTPHPDPAKIALKTPDQWTLMGRPQPNLDVPQKVTGQCIYGIDVRFPGALYAAARSCPVWDSGVKKYDAEAIKHLPGVLSVMEFQRPDAGLTRGHRYSGGIIVVADTWWNAKSAIGKLPIEWDILPESARRNSADMRRALFGATGHPGERVVDIGDVDTAFLKGARVVEAEYSMPYRARARMEPGNATVIVGKDRVDIWVGDQSPQETIASAAQICGVSKDRVQLHLCHLGGGYGRNGNGPSAEIAMVAAKAFPGRTVHTILTREEDWNTTTCYAAQTVGRFRAALDADGWPVAFEARMAMDTGGSGISSGLDRDTFPYGIPNYRHTINYVPFHVPVAVRRDDGQPALFFRESFIDELAGAAGIDPYRYRRELVSRAKFDESYKKDLLSAMDMAAESSGWGRFSSKGEGMGMAINAVTNGVGYTQCQVCRMTVSRAGDVRINRVDVAATEGFGAVNPLSFTKQIEGAINWELDDLFNHEFVVEDGRMVPNNFHSVFTGRMAMYPREVNIRLFKSKRWVIGPTEGMSSFLAAASNALYGATGKRARATPLKNDDLSWA